MSTAREDAIREARAESERAYENALQHFRASGRRWDKRSPVAKEAERAARQLVRLLQGGPER
jgi:hypothetical protein